MAAIWKVIVTPDAVGKNIDFKLIDELPSHTKEGAGFPFPPSKDEPLLNPITIY